jgi:carbohydrate diacid regulator
MKSINRILKDIKQLASIDVSLFTQENFLADNPSFVADFEQNNELKYENGNTYFALKINSVSYIAQALGEQSTAVVALIRQLIYNVEVDDFDTLSFESKIRKLLLGELSDIRCLEVKNILGNVDFFSLGLITENSAKQTELENFLETFKNKDDIIVKLDDKFMMYYCKVSNEYNNAEDFANILYENVKEELCIDLKVSVVGEIESFESFCLSYFRAVETHELGKVFAPRANVCTYRNFAVSKLILSADKKLLKETLESVLKEGSENVWEDEELMTTADAFINNSLNISETSRVLYIHRNTLMYRLDKIERETGYNLRVFADAVVFKFITVIRTVLADK